MLSPEFDKFALNFDVVFVLDGIANANCSFTVVYFYRSGHFNNYIACGRVIIIFKYSLWVSALRAGPNTNVRKMKTSNQR